MKLFYLLTLLIASVQGKLRLDPLVQTNSGLVRGLNANDGDYAMFLGIPYAHVNQSNVFGDAIPVSKFENEVLEAYYDSPLCPQIEDVNNTIAGTLDCLQLNIYVPNVAAKIAPLPVIIYIHGGFLRRGFANRYYYGPKFLVRHEVILVTVNYRLGPYGFMCLDIPEIPGNQGLKDQYLAIKWIKENIKEFGGDPSQMTLMGESAGSKCVEAHMLTNNEMMFNKAIMQSGSILGPDVVDPPDTGALTKLAQHLGFMSNDTEAIIQFLSDTNTNLVIAAADELNLQFQMCVEKKFEDVNQFIHEHPEHSNYAKTSNVPILIGFNSRELMSKIKTPSVLENPEYIKQSLKSLFSLEDSEDMVDIVRNFYIGDEQSSDMKVELIDFISDFTYNYPIQRSVELFLKNNAYVYQYLFSYDGERNLVKNKANLTLPGAAHADELGYLFDLSYNKEVNENDQIILDAMTGYWTKFVKTGNPNSEMPEFPITWQRATEEKIYFMNINSTFSIGTRPFHERLTFWKLFFKHNEENHVANIYFSKH